MKKIIRLLIVTMMVAVATTSTAMAITFDGVPNEVTLDTGESQTFTVTIAGTSGGSQTFNVNNADQFTVKINGSTVSTMAWSGASGEFDVEIINDKGASNGVYIIQYEDIDAGASVSVTHQIEIIITAIPEFPTIALPVAAILGLAFIFQRRREED